MASGGGAAAPYRSRSRRHNLGMNAAIRLKPGVGATGKGRAVMPTPGAPQSPSVAKPYSGRRKRRQPIGRGGSTGGS